MHIYSIYGGELVNILIDNRSGVPIYDQIFTQIKDQIINGTLEEDEMLPSIRGLAKDLGISCPQRAAMWHTKIQSSYVRQI